jgi:hypothetical protein
MTKHHEESTKKLSPVAVNNPKREEKDDKGERWSRFVDGICRKGRKETRK